MKHGQTILVVTALIGCSTPQEPIVRDDATRTASDMAAISSVSENANTPRIQIADKREFVRELARLGVSTGIADRDLIKKLFGWTPDFQPHEPNREFFRASFAQYPEKKTNVDAIVVSYTAGTQESEKGTLNMSLWPEEYCIRLDDLTAALGPVHSFYRPAVPKHGTLKVVTDTHFATYRISKVMFSFAFEYQECVQRISAAKNLK